MSDKACEYIRVKIFQDRNFYSNYQENHVLKLSTSSDSYVRKTCRAKYYENLFEKYVYGECIFENKIICKKLLSETI